LGSAFTSDALLGETPDFNLRFPALPKTLEEVSKLISERTELPDTPRLADIVRADPIIAAFVLRRVNSVHHGVRRSVGDVRKAVRLLGYQEVINIALAVGMMQLEAFMATEVRTTIFQDIMKASIGAAYFAQELAVSLRLPQKNKAFIAGLQHSVGRLVLLYNRPRDYEALWDATPNDFAPRASDERKTFGTDHCELGARALKWWNYPNTITAVIRNYLRPGALKDRSLRGLALALSVAVSASEQVCLSMTEKKGQAFFTPPPATHALARMTRKSSAYLIDLVESKREQALDYIGTMLRP